MYCFDPANNLLREIYLIRRDKMNLTERQRKHRDKVKLTGDMLSIPIINIDDKLIKHIELIGKLESLQKDK